jgi:hypothetical protein
MKKIYENVIQTLIQKRFSYLDLVIITVVEWIILNLKQ